MVVLLMEQKLYCNVINGDNIDKKVVIQGWVNRRRDHGGVIFIDCRDHTGMIQCVCNPKNKQLFALAETLRAEYVVEIMGIVGRRPNGKSNPDMPSGDVEITTESIKIINVTAQLPFLLTDRSTSRHAKDRALQLRTPAINALMIKRAKITYEIRKFLVERHSFHEIETPLLTKSTPEGARDFVVPSRTHPGCFYALPQSPQIYKQLLMVGGIHRYYQIARCFRDEGLRKDRQPEFTQVDLEMAFVTERQVMDVAECLIRELFKKFLQIDLPNPIPTLSYQDVMRDYGTDRPDLRNPLKLVDIADIMQDSTLAILKQIALDENSRIVAIKTTEHPKLSRKYIEQLTNLMKQHGMEGLSYIKISDIAYNKDDDVRSPLTKYLTKKQMLALLNRVGAHSKDIVFIGGAKQTIVNNAMSVLRMQLAEDLELMKSSWAPVWIVNFPMFEFESSTSGQRLCKSMHHPFTSPQDLNPEKLMEQPAKALAKAYDIVINGYEIGGGSIRIHDASLQTSVFNLLNINAIEAEDKFGHLLSALRFGCPPHGGIALGLDRLLMLMLDVPSIKEVIAFPKTQTGQCLLTQAPTRISNNQLQELSLRLRERQ
jgi:aspartyl-tRNA synthetase